MSKKDITQWYVIIYGIFVAILIGWVIINSIKNHESKHSTESRSSFYQPSVNLR